MVLAQSHILLCSHCMISIGFILVIILVYASALSFDLPNINPSHQNKYIIPEKDAYISNQGIQLTPFQQQKAGRAIYTEPFRLWEKKSRNLTDFNTYFSFVIDSRGSLSFADGLAFFLVPNGSTPKITAGGAFGLPIDPVLITPTTPFVAVEFDTYPNGWDPTFTPATHVGIDINSLTSNATEVWYNNITGGTENEAWINYDSSSKNLSVIFTGVKNNTKVRSSISLLVDLREYLPEWVTIGFSASTGALVEKNNVKSWQFNSSLQTI